MSTPRSIRFDDRVADRLASFVARHPGRSSSSVAARFVDEGLRMDEFPGIGFREGAMGRRAYLVGGPDVWEVVRAIRSARAAEPHLSEPDLLRFVFDNSGVPVRLIRTAVDYWAAYPDQVDSLVDHADRVEADLLRASDRTSGLLAP